MYQISRLIDSMIAPPGSMLFLALLALPFLLSKKGGKRGGVGIALLAIAFLSFATLSLKPVARLFVRPLESGFEALSPIEELERAEFDDYNAVIVLGGDSVSFAPEEGGRTALGPVMSSRFVYGLRLAKRLGLPLIVTGASPYGSGLDGMVKACERVALDFGVEEVKLVLEGQSMNTWENAVKVRDLLDSRGAVNPRVLLVTSAWHMKRGMASFAKQGIEVLPAPTDYMATDVPLAFHDWLPSAEAYRMVSAAIHEYAGSIGYSLKRARKD